MTSLKETLELLNLESNTKKLSVTKQLKREILQKYFSILHIEGLKLTFEINNVLFNSKTKKIDLQQYLSEINIKLEENNLLKEPYNKSLEQILIAQVKSLQTENKELKSGNTKYQADIIKIQEEKNKLISYNNQLSFENKPLKNRNNLYEQQNFTLQQRNKELEEKIKTNDEIYIDKTDTFIHIINDLKSDLKELSSTIQNSSDELFKKEIENNNYNKNVKQLVSQNTELKETISLKNIELKKLKLTNSNLEFNYKELKYHNDKNISNNNIHSVDFIKYNFDIQTLQDTINTLKEENLKLTHTIKTNEELYKQQLQIIKDNNKAEVIYKSISNSYKSNNEEEEQDLITSEEPPDDKINNKINDKIISYHDRPNNIYKLIKFLITNFKDKYNSDDLEKLHDHKIKQIYNRETNKKYKRLFKQQP